MSSNCAAAFAADLEQLCQDSLRQSLFVVKALTLFSKHFPLVASGLWCEAFPGDGLRFVEGWTHETTGFDWDKSVVPDSEQLAQLRRDFQPIVCAKISSASDSPYASTCKQLGAVGVVLIPFKQEEEALGVIGIFSSQEVTEETTTQLSEAVGLFAKALKSVEAVEAQDLNRWMLEALAEVQKFFIAVQERKAAFDHLLKLLLEVTESEFGFIGEVLHEENGTPYLKIYSFSNIAWNEAARKIYEEHAKTGLEFRNLETLFGEVIRKGQPVIANHPSADPRRGGLPPGHPPLQAFMGLPFKAGQEMLGMVGVANRPLGYSRKTATALEPLLVTCGSLIQMFRTERLRSQAEAALRESELRLRLITEASTDGLWEWNILTNEVIWSERTFQMLGYARAAFGVNLGFVEKILHPDDVQYFRESLRAHFEEDRAYDLKHRLLRSDGTYGVFHARGKAERDGQGKPMRMFGSITDVTEVQRQSRLMQMTEQLGEVGGWELELGCNRLYWTAQTYRIHELDPQSYQPTVETAVQFYTPESMLPLRQALLRAETWGEAWDLELAITTAKGRRREVRTTGQVSYEGGKPARLFGAFHDISQIKLAEQAVRLSEEKFSLAFHASPNAIVITRLDDGVIIEANIAFCRKYEVTVEQARGKTVYELGIWHDTEDRDVLLQKLARRSVIRDYEKTVFLPDGTKMFSLLSIEPITINGVSCLLTVSQDITEQKIAEKALRESEQRFRAIFNSTFEFVGLLQTDGLLLEANQTALDGAGISKEEVVGKYFWETPWWSHSPVLQARLKAAIEQAAAGYASRFEAEHPAGNGKVLTVDFSLKPIFDPQGKAVLLLPEGHDITERKRGEKAWQALVRGTTAVGEVFFRSLVKELAAALGVKYAFIGQMLPGEAAKVRTLAFWADGNLGGNFEYDLSDTPCAVVSDRQVCRYSGDVQERFPKDKMLIEMGLRSYFGTPLVGADGTVLGLMVVLDDKPLPEDENADALMTVFASRAASELERLYTERALRESEAHLRATLEVTPNVAVQWYDPDGRVLFWNRASETMFGWSASEAMGRTLDQLIHTPEETKAFVDLLKQLEGAKAPFGPVEYKFRRRDQTTGICLSTVCRVGEMNGRSWFACIDVDVTAQKAAEEALRQSEARYRLLLDSLSDLVAEISQNGVFVYVNPAFDRLLGYSAKELLGTNIFAFIHPEDVPVLAPKLALAEASAIYRYRHKNGQWRWIESAGKDFTLPSGERRAVIISRDITERREAEERNIRLEAQLRQSQKMEAIGTLAGGIAHDFNNILAAIVAYADLARGEVKDRPEVHDDLTQVLQACDRAKDLVRQILSFSRQQKQERRPLHLPQTIHEVMKLMRSTLPATIELISEVDQEVPQVLADPTQMHQIMMNLCANAAHAMRGRQGCLRVELASVEVGTEQGQIFNDIEPGSYVRVSVSDTGHGMDAATQKRIFEPFYTTKAPGEGTGLGLAVVHGIVKDHEGVILVDSKPGTGTKFELYFPVCEREISTTVADTVALKASGAGRILFVDDERSICVSIKRILERHGFTVFTETSPFAALAMLRSMPEGVDLVVTDLTMPGMTGIDLTMQIFQSHPNMPVLLATGFSGVWTADKVHSLGIKALIPKPINFNGLIQTIEEVLTESRKGKS